MRRLLAARARSTLYVDEGPEGRVVLKVLTSEAPGLRELLALDNDLDITRGLGVDGVRRAIRRDRVDGRHALVLSYVEGEPLSAWAGSMASDLRRLLRAALSLSRLLGQLHARGVVHKDLKPSNVLYDGATEQVTLIDFGISSRVDARASGEPPSELEGTLAYMAPEQTGRLHRPVDARSDLYALGATLYELLTGKPPFVSDDPVELVHAHLARPPASPRALAPATPQPLSDLVLRLLAKNPDDRYQTAQGVAYDLGRILDALDRTGSAEPFALGDHDVSERLRLPERLYGRERELLQLRQALDRASTGRRELLLIGGYSGAGKTSLVRELSLELAARGGFLVAGKFELLGPREPHYALVGALRDLVAALLGQGEDELALARGRLVAELSGQGQVLVDLLPELGRVLGPQPRAPELAAGEEQLRLVFVLRALLRGVARPERPVLLFLDDLQWADQASLSLLGELSADPSPGLLLVGAFRDNEVGPEHPLVALLDELAERAVPLPRLAVGELPREAVEALLSDALRAPLERVAPLSALVHEKTRGNAFFVRQLIGALRDEGALTFDLAERAWRWDDEALRARRVTDNVADFVSERLVALAKATQRALGAAACLGAEVAPARVAALLGEPPQAAVEALWPAVEAGLLVAVGAAYRLSSAAEAEQLPDAVLRFVHDRVQQQAACQLSDDERAALHLRAGRLARAGSAGGADEFSAVGHFNQALHLLTDADERREVARLNLEAARKAKRAAAHGHALGYLRAGLLLLPERPFEVAYPLALALHSEAAEAAYLANDLGAVVEHGEQVQRSARRPLDRVQATTAMMLAALARGDMSGTLDLGWSAVRALGVDMPREPGHHHIAAALAQVKMMLVGRRVEALLDRPRLADPTLEAALNLLDRMIPPAFRSGSRLFPLLVLRIVALSLRHGHAPVSCFGYASYGIMLSGILGDLEGGYRFGRLALRLTDRLGAESHRAKVLFVFANFLQHWREPLARSIPTHFDAYRSGLATGNVFEALWAAVYRAYWMFCSGAELDEVDAQLAAIGDLVRHDDTARTTAALLRQAVAGLRGDGASDLTSLRGEHYDEAEAERRFRSATDKIEPCAFHLLKARLGLLSGSPSARHHIEQAERHFDAITAMPFVREIHFYGALIRLRDQRRGAQGLGPAIERSHKRLREWARHEPSAGYRVALVEAEAARNAGDVATARGRFEAAIAGARAAAMVHDEALACELAAEVHERHPVLETALREAALRAYRQWGARARVAQLSPALASDVPSRSPSSLRLGQTLTASTLSITHSTSHPSSTLDVVSALKAAAAISAELHRDRLLAQLLRIVVENAGAQRGAVALTHEGELLLCADSDAHGAVRVLDGTPLAQAQTVCEPMLRFVARTGEKLTLADACADPRFASHPFVRRHQVRSVLCTPILHQGRLLGVVYLENNLAPGSFTPDRLQLLDLLASQAAIALENARLVTHLDATVAQRTRELHQRNDQLRESLDRLATELAEAAAYVRSLLPAPSDGSPRLRWRFLPSAELGGDAFGYHLVAPGQLALYLIDVTGHGVASALHSVSILSSLQTSRLPGADFLDPSSVLAALNRSFPASHNTGLSFTAFYGVLDLSSGSLRYADAGHPPPVLLRGPQRTELDLTGPIVGILPETPFDTASARLLPGDRLFVFSDGVYELCRPDGSMLTFDVFLDAISDAHRSDDPLASLEAFARSTRGGDFEDDFSLLMVDV